MGTTSGRRAIEFAIDVDGAAASNPRAFRLTSEPPTSSDAMVFELGGFGRGETLAELDADLFRFYGRFAENAQSSRGTWKDLVAHTR